MATLIELPDLRSGYVTLVDHVVRHGQPSSPRGLPIRELEDVTFTVADLQDTLPVGVGRDLNTLIAAVEALQLQAGASTPDLLVAVAPQFASYMEDDEQFHGAYGNRVGFQVQDVLDKIEEDRDTRQAIITLWDAILDNEPNRRDYPCTVALGFRVRRDHLDLSVLMRSNDVWLGTAYDVFQFTQLQWTIAHELGIPPGTYTHTAWSLHIYERDLPRVAKLHPPSIVKLQSIEKRPVHPTGIRSSREGDHDWSALAEDLLFNPEVLLPDLTLNESAVWYRERLLQAHAKLRGDA